MARKKLESGKKKIDSELSAVSSTSEVQATTTPYEVGTWSGLPLYKCLLCNFDTLSEDKIFAHLEEHRLGKSSQTTPQPTPLQGEGVPGDVYEIELKEIDSTVDEDGNVRKTYTIKE